jgi:phosphatidylinositol alpha-1,6-mannosyltransferase
LNLSSLVLGVQQKPDVVLSAHIITSPAAQALRRLTGVPVVQYLYGLEATARPGLTRFAARNAQAVIAISRYTQALARIAGAPESRIHLIHPGVDLPPREAVAVADVPELITVASLKYRYKGHDVIIRALPLIRAAVPEARWVVVGDGDLRRYLESLIAAHGLREHVDLVGSVSDAERDERLCRASVMVMPSRIPADGVGGEGYGIAFSEAAVQGVPVVGGNVAGARDAVDDGVTGLLVDPESPLAVATAVTELLRHPERGRQLADAARRRAERLAWPNIAREVEDLILRVARA